MRFRKQLRQYTQKITRRVLCENLENRLLLSGNSPSISSISPANGATNVALNVAIEAEVNLPNGGINPTTVNESTFYLYQTAFPNDNAKFVTASAKTTGGGDALLLTPLSNLLPNTSYTLVVNAGMTDVNGDAFTPFTEAFTTANTPPPVSQNFAFSDTALPTTDGYAVTDMQVGPDGLMYASTETGQILRFPINSDGTLGTPQVITSLQTANGGNQLITGFAFDPSFIANPSAPMLWVSDTYYALSGATNAPNFTSKLTVMSGANLQKVTDAIIDLPRSVADHVNDQPVFQPGTDNLFFCQAGENASGAPDTTWGNRPETLLSSAILEVDTSELNLSGPALNVLTPDATNSSGVSLGGTYSPYAAGAPLTIYATGIRNAFSLIFDDSGQLWAPLNGSSSGGNAPAGPGNSPPALTDIQQVEEDTLVKVEKDAYYGHPDPVRSQYVLGQGNPSTGAVPGLAFTAYPVGTNPDPDYQLPNYVFGLHVSPDGIIEYEGNAFGGALNGKFLVTDYSAPDNIAVLSRDSNDNIVGGLDSSATSPLPDYSVSGFQDLNSPLAITEDQATGYIYVSQLGADNIVLLKPSSVQQQISASAANVVFNTIATGNTGAGPSPTETVTITNTGADPLDLTSIGIVNASGTSYASDFTIVNAASEPTSLASVGTSFTFQIQFRASIVGLESAVLQIKSNDPVTPALSISLGGIGTAGVYGSDVPSLVQVLRAYGIATIVGAGPDDVNINTVAYPENPDPSSQEVTMQQMVAATSGPVTITPLASFSTNSQPVSEIGYYTPGDASATTKLFSITQADSQAVNPTAVGTTSFSPGSSPFGLYAYFPGVTTPNSAPDYHYSQDALNASLDPANPRKIRFFPYETSTGTVVPNTYVFAIEDYNDPTYNSFANFVGIISNVTGGAATPANLAVASNTSSAVGLTWTAAAGATSYTVEREDPGSSTFTVIATGLTSPTYTDTDFMVGQTYQYEVQAVNALNSSSFTPSVSATPPITGLKTPTNVQVGSASVNGVVLTWGATAGATSYEVQRENSGQSSFINIASGLTSPTYTDTSVAAAQSYSYQIIAVYPTGDSLPSSAVTAAVPVPPETLSVAISKGVRSFVQFTTAASTVVTIKLNGAGTATVNFTADTISQSATGKGIIVSGTNVTIASITTTGTTAGASLSVSTRGGSNTVNIGAMTVGASLNSIIAPTAALVGNLSVTGSINKITLGSAVAAILTIGGKLGVFQVTSVTGITLTAGGIIGNITAASWSSNHAITAASINSINLKGNAQIDVTAGILRSLHVQGELHDSVFTLSAAGAQDLANLSAFSIVNTEVNTTGNIGTIAASMLVDSKIYAGAGGAVAFPPVGSAFPAAATIANVILKKMNGVFSDTNSSIAASRISRLSLGNVQFSNGGIHFGVEAVSIKLLSAANPSVKPFTFHNLTTSAIVSADFAAKKIVPQDFAVEVL